MSDIFTIPLVIILKGVLLFYDVLTFIPSYLIYKPWEKLEESKRVKARSITKDKAGPWRTVDCKDELTTEVVEGIRTLDALVEHAVEKFNKRPCLGTRPTIEKSEEEQPNGKKFVKVILGDYEWHTYKDMYTQVNNIAKGLLAMGQKPRENVCIFAETREEWVISALACFKANLPVVTVYATLGEEALIHAINESDSKTVITTDELMPKFKKNLKEMDKVRRIVYMGSHYTPKKDDFPDDVKILSLAAVQEKGQHSDVEFSEENKSSPDDMAILMYTSGTTGTPKGVMMSHKNIISAMSGMIPRVPDLGTNDTFIAYLPLAHVLELVCELSCIIKGTQIGFSSPQTMTDHSTRIKKGSKGDATVLRPTVMAAVPLIMKRIRDAVKDKAEKGGPLQNAVFKAACDYKEDQLKRGFNTPIFNKLIFSNIQQVLGGRVRLMLCGSAPLTEQTQRFINVCLGCPVGQGYGLTETCGAGTIQEHTDLSVTRVGHPLRCCQIMLKKWEEGGYNTDSNPPRGEVLVGGDPVALGYYKNEEKTKEEFKEIDGVRYFATGDIGEIQRDGVLKIIDRIKDLVKLQGGEYVALNKVENALKNVPEIENICAYGDSDYDYLVALVCPNPKKLKAMKVDAQASESDWEEYCQDEAVKQALLDNIKKAAKEGKLQRMETPQKIYICSEEWTVENDMVTDTFKLKRRNIKDKYEDEIKAMLKDE